MREQQSGLGGNHQDDVRHLPRVRIEKNRAAAQAAAYRQAAYEAADQGYTGHDAGLHPENRPFQSTDLTPGSVKRARGRTNAPATLGHDEAYELEEDESYYTTRLPTSARRYPAYHVSPEHIVQRGNQRLHVRYVDIPPRSSRHAQLPPQRPRERHTDEYEGAPPRGSVRQGTRFHPLVWIGVFLMLFILGWIGLNGATTWWQGVQNDWKYGHMRHFEINAVVGHTDSATSPSHFTAENNNGDVYVIELPGGESSKSRIFQITTIPNNVGNPPVTLSFQDINHDGKLDMIVYIGDTNAMLTVILFNNGQTFVSKL